MFYYHIPYNPEQYTHLNRIGESNLFELSNEPSGQSPFYLLTFKSDPQTHGFIRRQPKILSDIGSIFQIDGVPFPIFLQRILNGQIKELLQNQKVVKRKLAFHSWIPVKRHSDDAEPSSWEVPIFFNGSKHSRIRRKIWLPKSNGWLHNSYYQ